MTEFLFEGRYRGISFEFEGRVAEVVFPDTEAAGKPFTLKTEYSTAFTQLECRLLERGIPRAYVANQSRWGHPDDLKLKARFVRFVAESLGLADKCIPIGYSCGGLHAVKLAGYHPECVALLCLDAPVIDLLSCPMYFGHDEYSLPRERVEMLDALSLTVPELLVYRDHPYDHLAEIVRHGIPCALVYGDADSVVLWEENAALVEKAYAESGVPFLALRVPGRGYHPHDPLDMTPLVDFVTSQL